MYMSNDGERVSRLEARVDNLYEAMRDMNQTVSEIRKYVFIGIGIIFTINAIAVLIVTLHTSTK